MWRTVLIFAAGYQPDVMSVVVQSLERIWSVEGIVDLLALVVLALVVLALVPLLRKPFATLPGGRTY